MKVGLQASSFTFPGGASELAPTLERIVRTADEVGFDSIWVMDHLFRSALMSSRGAAEATARFDGGCRASADR